MATSKGKRGKFGFGFWRALGAAALGMALAVRAGENPASDQRQEAYRRAGVVFDRADFFKPAEVQTNELAFKFAPLFLTEVSRVEAVNWAGTLSVSNGAVAVEGSQPMLYWKLDTAVIHKQSHLRLTWLWTHSDPVQRSNVPTPAFQGMRLTLNTQGEPVIWEILDGRGGLGRVFVAQSLEAVAAAQFGKPLPGRRYSIEQATNQAPSIIVARVIEDGPVPMGPVIYLDAASRAVDTVLCRCMPPQAKQLHSTCFYQWQALPPMAESSALTKLLGRGDEVENGAKLEQSLRLPSGF